MNWTKQNIFCDILHNFQETDVKREIFSSLIPIKYSCAEDSVMKCFVSMIAAPTSPTSSISPQHRDTAQPGGFVLPIYSQYNSFYRNNMDTRGAAAWPEQTSVCLSWLLRLKGQNLPISQRERDARSGSILDYTTSFACLALWLFVFNFMY